MQSRTLYGPEPLGISAFVSNQERAKRQFGEMADRFKSRMVQFLEKDEKSMVFTEDLKNMVFLAEAKPGDIDLVVAMIKRSFSFFFKSEWNILFLFFILFDFKFFSRFHSQNKSLRFGGFVFGPVVMRLFHHLKCSDVALKVCFSLKFVWPFCFVMVKCFSSENFEFGMN